MQKNFQVFEAGVIVWENVAFTIAAVAPGEKVIQIADPLFANRPVPLFNCAPE
jgi:hypothetical protein